MMRRTIAMLVLAAVATSAPAVGQGAEGHHALVGAAETADGAWVSLSVAQTPDGIQGWVRIARTATAPLELQEVTVDCLETGWRIPTYPVPPYLPYHFALASGTDVGGVRHYITAYDLVARPVGLHDRLRIDTVPSSGACGANPKAEPVIRSGDVTIAP